MVRKLNCRHITQSTYMSIITILGPNSIKKKFFFELFILTSSIRFMYVLCKRKFLFFILSSAMELSPDSPLYPPPFPPSPPPFPPNSPLPEGASEDSDSIELNIHNMIPMATMQVLPPIPPKTEYDADEDDNDNDDNNDDYDNDDDGDDDDDDHNNDGEEDVDNDNEDDDFDNDDDDDDNEPPKKKIKLN